MTDLFQSFVYCIATKLFCSLDKAVFNLHFNWGKKIMFFLICSWQVPSVLQGKGQVSLQLWCLPSQQKHKPGTVSGRLQWPLFNPFPVTQFVWKTTGKVSCLFHIAHEITCWQLTFRFPVVKSSASVCLRNPSVNDPTCCGLATWQTRALMIPHIVVLAQFLF